MSEDINFSKLQKEFTAAKAADEKYLRENNAKFRAVNQKVGSYDEFRDIVAASHLNPLDKNDIIGTDKVQQRWNSLYSSNKPNEEGLNVLVASKETGDVIDSCDKFTKAWKRQGQDSHRIDLLLSIQECYLNDIFKCDIPGSVLEDCIRLFEQVVSVENSMKICSVMKAFSCCQRFALSLKFLSKKDKQHLHELLVDLERLGCDVKDLITAYEF